MISVGTNIQSSSDELQKVSLGYLAERLINPQPHIEAKIKRLRIIRELDSKQYARIKRELPYFVCGTFAPPYRRSENFAYTEYFVIDLDHLSDHGYDSVELKKRLSKDSRVYLIFESPGKDGLKMIFRLEERCYDSGLYSIFYKSFTKHLGELYDIEEIIDYSTNDVSRACFISHDPDAYYNPMADNVPLQSFVDMDSPLEMFELKKELEIDIKENPDIHDREIVSEPDEDVLQKIKETLKDRKKQCKEVEKDVYVPEEVENILNRLSEYVGEFQIELYESIDIQYGKKLRFRLGVRQAEINLFFGKRGFTAVQCPRNGTSAELNEVCHEIVKQFIKEIS